MRTGESFQVSYEELQGLKWSVIMASQAGMGFSKRLNVLVQDSVVWYSVTSFGEEVCITPSLVLAVQAFNAVQARSSI